LLNVSKTFENVKKIKTSTSKSHFGLHKVLK